MSRHTEQTEGRNCYTDIFCVASHADAR